MAYDGQDGLRQAQLKLPDLIVLDLMLPVKPGLEVCRELRNGARTRDIPIVMVTAKAEESDQLVGFAMGADDYVTKPYSIKVLIERVKKEIRKRQAQEEPVSGSLIESQGVTIDRHSHRALYGDEELPLTPTEFRLLEVLLRQAGRAFTRYELMDAATSRKTPSSWSERSTSTSQEPSRRNWETPPISSRRSAASVTVSMSRGLWNPDRSVRARGVRSRRGDARWRRRNGGIDGRVADIVVPVPVSVPMAAPGSWRSCWS